MSAFPATAMEQMAEVVGPRHVITDPEVIAGSCIDWTGRFRGHTPALVRPGSTAEVAALVSLCRDAGIALTPQGGNTGLVGGSVPLSGEVLISLHRLGQIDVDGAAGQATAGAGCTIGEIQRAAASQIWLYGVDLGSRDTATVGGTIATNAGGLRMLRYGDTRAQVLGVEAVLGDGSVVSHLGGLLKDNTGYHLPSLLCGSEGTLAIVTRARLRLMPSPRFRSTALLAFPTARAAVHAALELRRKLTAVEAVELFFADGVLLLGEVYGLRPPFSEVAAAYVLIEAASNQDPTDELAESVAGLPGLRDSAHATDPARCGELWRYRELHTEAVNAIGPPHKLDVSLPAEALADFIEQVPTTVHSVTPGARVFLWGHAGDGNIHVNVTGLAIQDDAVDDAVFRFVAGFGGSISAEHGIGSAKRRWLHLVRTESEIAAFRAIKRALDPAGILNPNVLLP